MVSGAVSMARIARERGWSPGSFLNENFDFERWSEALGSELLNAAAEFVKVRDLAIERDTFVRLQADTKDFDGRVFDAQSFEAWKAENDSLLDVEVIAASAQDIYREYRMFMTDDDVMTAAQYMQAGRPLASPDVDPEAIAYATHIARRWRPADAFVLDIALTADGYRVVEFNNINSCGFYASDVGRYVAGIELRFGENVAAAS